MYITDKIICICKYGISCCTAFKCTCVLPLRGFLFYDRINLNHKLTYTILIYICIAKSYQLSNQLRDYLIEGWFLEGLKSENKINIIEVQQC